MSRDLKPSRPIPRRDLKPSRPRLKNGSRDKSRLETVTKSPDSITDFYSISKREKVSADGNVELYAYFVVIFHASLMFKNYIIIMVGGIRQAMRKTKTKKNYTVNSPEEAVINIRLK